MPENEPDQPDAPTPPTPPESPTETPPARETDWKAEARKWEERAKANKSAAEKLAEIEEANKTAEQKRDEELEKLRKENESYKTREQVAKWKEEVAEAAGIPAAALAGSTKEEIEAHAETLKPLIAGKTKGAVGPYVPSEGTGSGAPAASAGQEFADFLTSQLGH